MPTPSLETIPLGLCQCGCGGQTKISTQNDPKRGYVKGRPQRLLPGHNMVRPVVDFSDALPFKIDGDYCKLIPLTKGHYHVVDASRYEDVKRFRWFINKGNRSKNAYARNSRIGLMHRYLLGLTKDDPRTGDHRDPSRTWDNRIRNLRLADESEQKYNIGIRSNNTTGYKGVVWEKRRKHYFAQIRTRGKNRYLGHDADPAVCAEMYRVAAEKDHGEFARTS
jgi:hypothetical protein